MKQGIHCILQLLEYGLTAILLWNYFFRDEAQAKIIALRDKAEKEYQAYTQEGKELDRSLEQDRRLKEFMAAKIAERQNNSTGNQKQTENTLKKGMNSII